MTAQLASILHPKAHNAYGIVRVQDAASSDPDLVSAFGKHDVALRDASVRQLSATRRPLNWDADDSPPPRLLAGVRDWVVTVLDAVIKLGEQVVPDKVTTTATAEAIEHSMVRRMALEDQVAVAVTALAAERTTATKKIDEASNQTSELNSEVNEALKRSTVPWPQTAGLEGSHLAPIGGSSRCEVVVIARYDRKDPADGDGRGGAAAAGGGSTPAPAERRPHRFGGCSQLIA